MVYKPTPKSLLASSYSYSPPVKKPKLEYVPKSKSNFTSIATYVPSTSTSIKSNSDNESEVRGWDYLAEIVDSEPSKTVDKTPTYVPTKINRSTSEDVDKSTENVVKATEDEIENKFLTDDETERKRSKSKPEKTKSRHDRHKSSSKSTSRSHSSKNRQETSSKASTERSKSSKSSTHKSSHEKSKSHSSRSDSKSSLDRNGSESKRCDKSQSSTSTTKSSKLSSKTVGKKDDDGVSAKKTKPSRTSSRTSSATKKESVEIVPISSDNNISPSSVFDTDSEEDDVMAQCRMIFEEFKEVSNNGKLNDVVVSVLG